MSMQGEEDIDTGSYSRVCGEQETKETGKPLTEKEQKRLKNYLKK